MKIAIVASLIIFQVLLAVVSLALYGTLAVAFGIGGPLVETIFVILSITFLSASLLSHWYRGKWIAWYYTAAAYWFGLVNFLFVGVVAFYLIANVLYARDIYVSPALIAGVSLGALFLVHCYGTWTSGRAAIKRVRIALANLPADWRGKKIVFLSDVHFGNVRGRKFAEEIVRRIRALAPDMVVIGGDLYDGVACDERALIEPFRALGGPGGASKGVYFVTGNHEYFLPHPESALAAIRNAGIRILNDEKTEVDGLVLAGVDDQAAHKNENFKKILGKLNLRDDSKNKPVILIKHEPSNLETAWDAGISLVLSGHTHHGQIFPLNFFTHQIYREFDYGLKHRDGMQVYTSSGVGTWGPPLRLGTKSEIVLITLA